MTLIKDGQGHSKSSILKYCKLRITNIFQAIALLFILALIVIPTHGQSTKDTTEGHFYDDLLDHLVGRWNVTGIVHDNTFNLDLEAEWVLNHQYLRIYEKSKEVIPWLNTQFEAMFFIGYNHINKRFVVHEINVFGADDPTEGFLYAYRTENELKLVHKDNSKTLSVQRFTWEPSSMSWSIEARLVNDEKEGEIFINQKAIAAKVTSN